VKALREYIVEVPFRAREYHLVTASSAAEAKRKVDEGVDDTMIDWRTDSRSKANHARAVQANSHGAGVSNG
jgi:hypothetical protein